MSRGFGTVTTSAHNLITVVYKIRHFFKKKTNHLRCDHFGCMIRGRYVECIATVCPSVSKRCVTCCVVLFIMYVLFDSLSCFVWFVAMCYDVLCDYFICVKEWVTC